MAIQIKLLHILLFIRKIITDCAKNIGRPLGICCPIWKVSMKSVIVILLDFLYTGKKRHKSGVWKNREEYAVDRSW